MEYKGKVKSGLGVGAFYVEKIIDLFYNLYAVKLFPGTLNVELEEPVVITSEERISSDKYGGDYDILVKKVRILNHDSYILRVEKNNVEGGDHTLNIVEVVSDISFRNKYNLKDGDIVYLNFNN